MSEAGVSSGNGRAVPFQARAAYAGHQMFGSGDGAVLVKPEVARDLRQAAELQAPHETGGLLYGRAWRDSEGRYVLVDGFVQAGPDAGKTGEFSLSPTGAQLLRETAAKSFPGADEVGWWHTHRAPSPYSQTDFTMQRALRQPSVVGLLVFASGAPWATAYLGPDGRALGHPGTLSLPAVPGRVALAASGTGPRWNPFRRGTTTRPGSARGGTPRPGQPRGNPLRGYRLHGGPGPAGPGSADAPGFAAPAAVPSPANGARPPDERPAGARPPDARPAETKPAGAQPAGAQPAGAQPAQTKPADPQPADLQPADPQPTAPRADRSPDTLWQPRPPGRDHYPGIHHSAGARVVLWLAVCTGLGAVIAIIVLAATFVSSVVHAVGGISGAPSMSWSCDRGGAARVTWTCAATNLSPANSTVWWLVDGKPYRKGASVPVTVLRKLQVKPVLITPSGQQYSKGAKTLTP